MTFFRRAKKFTACALIAGLFLASAAPLTVKATVDENTSSATSTVRKKTGGGYAVTGQINGVGYIYHYKHCEWNAYPRRDMMNPEQARQVVNPQP